MVLVLKDPVHCVCVWGEGGDTVDAYTQCVDTHA
jgi:hypothetical protein